MTIRELSKKEREELKGKVAGYSEVKYAVVGDDGKDICYRWTKEQCRQRMCKYAQNVG